MGEPPVSVVVGEQHLTAPHGTVVAVAGSVEGDSDHRLRAVQTVLGHRRGDMGVVVLHLAQRQSALLGGAPCPQGGAVAGMPVGDQQARCDGGEVRQMAGGPLEGVQGGQVVHVPDVRGQPGVAAVPGAEGVLQVAAHGQRRDHRNRQRDREGA